MSGLVNLWHMCPKWHLERFPWHAGFTAVQFFFLNFFCPISVSICVYMHKSDCIEIVCELLLLPNNTVSETCLHKLGVV